MLLIFFHMLPKTEGNSEHIASCRSMARNRIKEFNLFKVRQRVVGNRVIVR